MIILDRPFHLGDWIKAGDLEGTVEEVGFRSTKVRTFAKTLISVPNSVITNMAVDNFTRMPKRRIKLSVGVTYESTPTQMRAAVGQIREMLKTTPPSTRSSCSSTSPTSAPPRWTSSSTASPAPPSGPNTWRPGRM